MTQRDTKWTLERDGNQIKLELLTDGCMPLQTRQVAFTSMSIQT